ncbi:unnamed protein product [Schistosoma mattheei]|uniref:Uncharacterized protein n=1 Tax=Schistosoma mattheei TaxID=31246 RepID=A0A3P8GA82_9TREM|nr:unnamed protein product [Schistosoma mattheei]
MYIFKGQINCRKDLSKIIWSQWSKLYSQMHICDISSIRTFWL